VEGKYDEELQLSNFESKMEMDGRTWPSTFIVERLLIALGDPRADELSYRAGTFSAFSSALRRARDGEGDITKIPRAPRHSGVSFGLLFKHWRSAFAGYYFEEDGAIAFSMERAKSECPTEFQDAETSTPPCRILPLEDVAVVAALAALQVYCRSSDRSGLFNCATVSELLMSTGIPVGRSRLPGSITATHVEKILSPSSHGVVGLADILILLRDWQNHGCVLSVRIPADWVVPAAPMAQAWPAFFSSSEGALVIHRSQVAAILAGAAECEIFVTDAGIRARVRGDGCVFIEMSCMFCASPGRPSAMETSVVSPLALGCRRKYFIEM